MSYEEAQQQFIDDLNAMHDAERRFLDVLQEMLQRATDTELQQGIYAHIDQTRVHIETLEQVFSQLGMRPRDTTNAAARGLVRHGQDTMARAGTPATRDVAIRGAAGAIEQFEIACYTSLIQGAEALKHGEVAALLRQALQQEQETARTLEGLEPRLLQAVLDGTGESPRTGTAQATDAPLDSAKGPREIDAGLIEESGTLIDEQGATLAEQERVP